MHVVNRRLSAFDAEARNVALAIAAVIGRDFRSAVVEAAHGPCGEQLQDALDEAVVADVLDEALGTVGQYRFSHDLIRQTLTSRMSSNRRLRMHWSIGQAISTLNPGDVDAIAFHLSEGVLAGDPLVAAQACVTAGDAADGRRGLGRSRGELRARRSTSSTGR